VTGVVGADTGNDLQTLRPLCHGKLHDAKVFLVAERRRLAGRATYDDAV